MKCGYCESEARGICKYCGAGVCADDSKRGRYVSGVAAQGQPGYLSFPQQWYDYLILENAIWCGRCTVTPYQKL